MTFLPPITPTTEPVEVWYHNWLYSVVPAEYYRQGAANAGYINGIYLAGYCKNCRKAFTTLLPHNDVEGYTETQLEVPRVGCINPKDIE